MEGNEENTSVTTRIEQILKMMMMIIQLFFNHHQICDIQHLAIFLTLLYTATIFLFFTLRNYCKNLTMKQKTALFLFLRLLISFFATIVYTFTVFTKLLSKCTKKKKTNSISSSALFSVVNIRNSKLIHLKFLYLICIEHLKLVRSAKSKILKFCSQIKRYPI